MLGNRRASDTDSPYLLSGYARCSVCGSALGVLVGGRGNATPSRVRSRPVPQDGTVFELRLDMNRMDAAVLGAIANEVFCAARCRAVVRTLTPSTLNENIEA